MFQNGQTEPKLKLWVTRRRTKVRREAKFVHSNKESNRKKNLMNEIFRQKIKF